jgi:hypothetical protein
MPRSSIKVGEGRLERPELVAQQQQFVQAGQEHERGGW